MGRGSGRDQGARAADTEAARRTGQTRGRSARAPVTALARVPLVPAVESPSRRVPILVAVVEAQPRRLLLLLLLRLAPRGDPPPASEIRPGPGVGAPPAVRAIGENGENAVVPALRSWKPSTLPP